MFTCKKKYISEHIYDMCERENIALVIINRKMRVYTKSGTKLGLLFRACNEFPDDNRATIHKVEIRPASLASPGTVQKRSIHWSPLSHSRTIADFSLFC